MTDIKIVREALERLKVYEDAHRGLPTAKEGLLALDRIETSLDRLRNELESSENVMMHMSDDLVRLSNV